MLGAILVHNDAYERVASTVRAEDFYRDAHKRIFTAIKYLIDDRKGVVDFVTLNEELVRRGELDEVGGPAYIASLADGVPRSTNVAYYGGIVREKALLRAVCFAANQALSDAYTAEDSADAILRRVDAEFLRLQHGSIGSASARDLRETVRDVTEYLDWRANHKGENTGVTTGFTRLDEMTFGWQPGDLIVIAARPSIGKTMLLLNNFAAIAATGKRCGLFSFEMRRRQLEFRLVSSVSGVPLTRILGGFLGAADYQNISEAFERIHTMPIVIDDQAGLTVQEIRSRVRRLTSETPLDIIGIDYVQLISGSLDRRGATRTEELTHISRTLKTTIAEEFNIPVIILSQLKRLEGRRPALEDLRESGSLEQDADVALLLHRRKYREPGKTEVIMAKHRNGPTGSIYLHADLDTVTFTNMADEEQVAEPEPEPARRRKRGKDAQMAQVDE